MSSEPRMPTVDDWVFESTYLEHVPVDPDPRNIRRQVQGAVATPVLPTSVAEPGLRAWSRETAQLVGLPLDPNGQEDRLAALFSGNVLASGMRPYASNYGGHQFGGWAGQLGDGRAITLGERIGPDGARFELQLKGAGPTPYSRMGDGRAVLRSSIREFLCSEAMHHLGVPTTRALSLVTSGEQVVRDMFYDGHPAPEPGAIVCRVAPSFLRFGSFELPSSRRDIATLKTLADYTVETYFPELVAGGARPGPELYTAWFHEVCRRTAVMITEWMRVGFVHGVMNTDNMSILGLTIDYGPYGWIDDFDPGWTPNTTDAGQRRYRFGSQATVAAWNLERFSSALHPLVGDREALQAGLNVYADTLEVTSRQMMSRKLGLTHIDGADDAHDPRTRLGLATEIQRLMASTPTDMTRFYRALSAVPVAENTPQEALLAPLDSAYYEDAERTPAHTIRTVNVLRALARHVRADGLEPDERRRRMHAANPKYVLRNYLAQEAIDLAHEGDFSRVHELLDLMRRPYDEQPKYDRFAVRRPSWARRKAGCSMLSCSS